MRILQCLNWDLNAISKHLEEIAEQGFDMIQITPVQPLKEEGKEHWWLCYQPCGFHIGNQYGSKEDLISLCQKASLYGIGIIPDVVFTHMAQGEKMQPHKKVEERLVNNSFVWREKKNLEGVLDYDDRYKVTHYCAGNLPGLNLYNWDLQDMIANFLEELIQCGVAGFRIDSGKSIPLPTDYFSGDHRPYEYPCDFLPRVIEKLRHRAVVYIEVLNVSPELIEQYANYGLVLTEMNYTHMDSKKFVAFAESHDQYFNWRPNVISPLHEKEITNMYVGKARHYENTLYYARPYSDEWKSMEIKDVHREEKEKRLLRR